DAVTWWSHMLDVRAYGLSRGAHHVTNLVLHIGSTLLLFALFRAMTGAFGRSLFVAALFAVHPLHVESVAWVAERKDVLSTFLGMLTLWAYLGYVRQPTSVRSVGVLVLLVAGLMAKPMLVTLPFVMLLLDVWPVSRVSGGWRLLVLEKIPWLMLACGRVCRFAARFSHPKRSRLVRDVHRQDAVADTVGGRLPIFEDPAVLAGCDQH